MVHGYLVYVSGGTTGEAGSTAVVRLQDMDSFSRECCRKRRAAVVPCNKGVAGDIRIGGSVEKRHRSVGRAKRGIRGFLHGDGEGNRASGSRRKGRIRRTSRQGGGGGGIAAGNVERQAPGKHGGSCAASLVHGEQFPGSVQ